MTYFVYVLTATGQRRLLSEHLHEQDAWSYAGPSTSKIVTDSRGVVLRQQVENAR